jgi:hypothetical protein
MSTTPRRYSGKSVYGKSSLSSNRVTRSSSTTSSIAELKNFLTEANYNKPVSKLEGKIHNFKIRIGRFS